MLSHFPTIQKLGSPPHLRGKQFVSDFPDVSYGITPAPAGKTLSAFFSTIEVTDHPRTCGENNVSFTRHYTTFGSPPHLRGKLLYRQAYSLSDRITPAPAGKTLKNDVDTL